MVATSLLSFVLLALAGVLLDSHRREWLSASSDRDDTRSHFTRRRVVRRSIATAVIAVVGVLVALWPVVPRVPLWVVLYTATLASLAGLIFTLGVWDAWASGCYYRDESRRRLAEHARALAQLVEKQRALSDDGAADAEAIGA